MAYSAPDDLYAYGLPRGSLPNPARLLGTISAPGTLLPLDSHGLGADVPVTFRAEAGGSLPSPLTASTTYYATIATDAAFTVSATAGGAAITLTTAGSRVLVVQALPIAAAIAWADALIDDMLPAHAVPLSVPYPPIIAMTSAELAVGKLIALTGRGSEALGAAVDLAHQRLARWGKGVPLRGTDAAAQPATNRAASASVPYVDRRGWHRSDGNIP